MLLIRGVYVGNTWTNPDARVFLIAADCGGSPRAIGAWPWPGPCRQARWAGRGSGVNGAPQARPRGARMRSTVEAGGADPDNARRSDPGRCDLRMATGTPGAIVMAGPTRAARASG